MLVRNKEDRMQALNGQAVFFSIFLIDLLIDLFYMEKIWSLFPYEQHNKDFLAQLHITPLFPPVIDSLPRKDRHMSRLPY